MTDKTDKPQPTTAAELKEAGLFKISAQVDIELYKAFKNACTNNGLKVKSQIELAMLQHLQVLDPEGFAQMGKKIKTSMVSHLDARSAQFYLNYAKISEELDTKPKGK